MTRWVNRLASKSSYSCFTSPDVPSIRPIKESGLFAPIGTGIAVLMAVTFFLNPSSLASPTEKGEKGIHDPNDRLDRRSLLSSEIQSGGKRVIDGQGGCCKSAEATSAAGTPALRTHIYQTEITPDCEWTTKDTCSVGGGESDLYRSRKKRMLFLGGRR